jgi:predicted CopG family antitoxin
MKRERKQDVCLRSVSLAGNKATDFSEVLLRLVCIRKRMGFNFLYQPLDYITNCSVPTTV